MEIKNGLLGELSEQISPNDYLASAVSDIPLLQKQDSIWYEYNQGGSTHCTLYASVTALGSVMNYKFSDVEIKEIIELSVKAGKDINGGRYLFKAVDLIRNYWNTKYPDRKVVSVQVQMLSEASDYRNKGYFIATTFKGNKQRGVDKNDNGMINGLEFKPSQRGHAVNTMFNGIPHIVDNYFGNKYNIYGLPNFEKLVKNGTMSGQGYVFLATTDEKKAEIKRKSRLKVLLEEVITLTNDKEFIKDCQTKIDFINKSV